MNHTATVATDTTGTDHQRSVMVDNDDDGDDGDDGDDDDDDMDEAVATSSVCGPPPVMIGHPNSRTQTTATHSDAVGDSTGSNSNSNINSSGISSSSSSAAAAAAAASAAAALFPDYKDQMRRHPDDRTIVAVDIAAAVDVVITAAAVDVVSDSANAALDVSVDLWSDRSVDSTSSSPTGRRNTNQNASRGMSLSSSAASSAAAAAVEQLSAGDDLRLYKDSMNNTTLPITPLALPNSRRLNSGGSDRQQPGININPDDPTTRQTTPALPRTETDNAHGTTRSNPHGATGGGPSSSSPWSSAPPAHNRMAPVFPDYKDQMQDRRRRLEVAAVAAVDAIPDDPGPDYKDQVRSRRIPSSPTNTNTTASASAALAVAHTLRDRGSGGSGGPVALQGVVLESGPEYKDQMQPARRSSPSSNPTSAIGPSNVADSGPDYKDQIRETTPPPPTSTINPTASHTGGERPTLPLPTYKEQVRPRQLQQQQPIGARDTESDSNDATGNQTAQTNEPTSSQQPPPPPPPETRAIRNDESPTVAVAQLHEDRPVVVYNATDLPVVSAGQDGLVVAEGWGILVDEIYDEEPRRPNETETNSNNEATDSPESVKEPEAVPSLFQTYRYVWIFLVAVVVGAIAVGGFCGSGACGGASTSNTNSGGNLSPTIPLTNPSEPAATAAPTAPTPTPIFVRGNNSYFTSTEELYFVADAYVNAVYYNDSNASSILLDELTVQYGGISEWDVSRLTDFSFLFYRGDRTVMPILFPIPMIESLFDEDISRWNVSAATTMEGMFAGAYNFSQNVSGWDTSQVTTMRAMFHSAFSFDGDLLGWDVGTVNDFKSMFFGCTSLRGVGLSAWNTSAARDMSYTFAGTASLAGNLSRWNVGRVTSFDSMFEGSSFNGDLSSWSTGRVETMSSMFRDATFFNGDLSTWDTSQVTTVAFMFYNAATFNGNLTRWNMEQVTDLSYTFAGAVSFNGDLPWNVSKVTAMVATFSNAQQFNKNISSWDTSRCRDMDSMLSLTLAYRGDLSGWNTGRVLRMSSMVLLDGCFRVDDELLLSSHSHFATYKELAQNFNSDISQWDVSNLEECSFMFRDADNFNVDISSWNISKVTVMSSMFQDASAFNQNLCAWGPRLTATANVVWPNMFLGSSCNVVANPVSAINGPWCHICNTTDAV